MVKTITQLPEDYNQPINITLNDRDLDIVSRNVVMLLIALLVNNIDEAIDCVMHVWYSAFIRKSHLGILQQQVRPLIQSVCEKIKAKMPGNFLGKTWEFGHHSLRLILQKSSWEHVLNSLHVPEGLTTDRANQIRTAVTLAESRKDYRDRSRLFQAPSRRVAKNRFRADGMLLPFGTPRDDFQEPNPYVQIQIAPNSQL